MGALCSACACMLFGCIRYQQMKTRADQLASYLLPLRKLAAGLSFSSASLPAQLQSCVPDTAHYLYKLGRTMENAGAASMESILETTGTPPLIPPHMQQILQQWLESLLLPDPLWRQKAMEHTLLLWEEETAKARDALNRKGTLSIRLSLLGGCALFILFC